MLWASSRAGTMIATLGALPDTSRRDSMGARMGSALRCPNARAMSQATTASHSNETRSAIDTGPAATREPWRSGDAERSGCRMSPVGRRRFERGRCGPPAAGRSAAAAEIDPQRLHQLAEHLVERALGPLERIGVRLPNEYPALAARPHLRRSGHDRHAGRLEL